MIEILTFFSKATSLLLEYLFPIVIGGIAGGAIGPKYIKHREQVLLKWLEERKDLPPIDTLIEVAPSDLDKAILTKHRNEQKGKDNV